MPRERESERETEKKESDILVVHAAQSTSRTVGAPDWHNWGMRFVSHPVCAAAILVAPLVVAGCNNATAFCEGSVSVAGYVTGFQQGLDNFSEDQYNRLRLDTIDALATTEAVSDRTESADPELLAEKIARFQTAMGRADWDVTVAIGSSEANTAASALGTPESLAQANVVEAAVIDACGLPTTLVPSSGSAETLPLPSFAAPTQTDPPTDTIDQASEDESQGRLVATLFSLTLPREKVVCLGRALQDVTDLSAAGANLAQYQGQFQAAFDECSIDFQVPRS